MSWCWYEESQSGVKTGACTLYSLHHIMWPLLFCRLALFHYPYTMHHIMWVCLSVVGFNSVGTCFGVGILVMSNYLWLERARISHFASLLWLHVYARLLLEPQSKCSIPLHHLAILPLAIVHANGEVIWCLHCCCCDINTHICTDCLYLRSCPSMLVLVIQYFLSTTPYIHHIQFQDI
jgi:hypothetical protein